MISALLGLAASLATQPAKPEPVPRSRTEIPFETARVLVRPSASVRHALLASGPPIPASGIAVTARCLVARDNGRSFGCEVPEVPDAWRNAARTLASLYQFDLSGLQFGPDERLGVVTITDRIVPADVRPPARLFHFTAAGAGNAVFTTAFGLAVMAYYPVGELRGGNEARMWVDCQVQPDLSLFCLSAGPTPGAPSPAQPLSPFQIATLQIMGNARVAPTLDNGAPAAGTVFHRSLYFHIPAE